MTVLRTDHSPTWSQLHVLIAFRKPTETTVSVGMWATQGGKKQSRRDWLRLACPDVTSSWLLVEFSMTSFIATWIFESSAYPCTWSHRSSAHSRTNFTWHHLLRCDILKRRLSLQLEKSPKYMLLSCCELSLTDCVTIEVSCWKSLNIYWVLF